MVIILLFTIKIELSHLLHLLAREGFIAYPELISFLFYSPIDRYGELKLILTLIYI